MSLTRELLFTDFYPNAECCSAMKSIFHHQLKSCSLFEPNFKPTRLYISSDLLKILGWEKPEGTMVAFEGLLIYQVYSHVEIAVITGELTEAEHNQLVMSLAGLKRLKVQGVDQPDRPLGLDN